MNQKIFSTVTFIVFSLIAILHALRLVYGWNAVIGGWEVPMWMSYLAVVFFVYLTYNAFKLR